MAGAAKLEGEKTGWRLCKWTQNACCYKRLLQREEKIADFCA